MNDGFELRSILGKGEGVFASRFFSPGEVVMIGHVEHELDHNHSHASQVGEDRFVLHGGLIPKLNHSCDPNCGIRLNRGAHDIVARLPIAPGDEITFDYAMRNYTIEHFLSDCRCQAQCCRGKITGWKDLPAQRKVDYRGFVAPYLLDMDEERAPARWAMS